MQQSPLTHFVRSARGVLLKGEGAWFIVSEMVPARVLYLDSYGSRTRLVSTADRLTQEEYGVVDKGIE
jgi:hypothetical protein